MRELTAEVQESAFHGNENVLSEFQLVSCYTTYTFVKAFPTLNMGSFQVKCNLIHLSFKKQGSKQHL